MRASFLKTHRWAVACTVLSAVWLALPNVLMRAQRGFYARNFPSQFASWTDNGTFSTMDSIMMATDNYQYAARIRQAAAHALPGDPYVKGRRSVRQTMTDFITYEAYATVFRLVGDHRRGWMAAQFLFSLLWVPALYALLLGMGASRGQALFLAALTTQYADLARIIVAPVYFHTRLIDVIKETVQCAFWPLGSFHYALGPTRPTGPLFTYPCLFLAGLAFVRGDERGGRSVIVGGIAGGLLAYVHADVWAAFHGAGFFHAMARTFLPGWKTRGAKRPWLMLMISGALSLPWLLNCWPTAEQLAVQDLAHLRSFAWGSLPFLAAGLYALRQPAGGTTLWCAGLLLALFGACNLQILTGWVLIQGHWYYIANIIIVLVAGLWALRRASEDTCLWLTAAVFVLSLSRLINYAGLHYQIYALPAAEEQAYDWLQSHTPADSVVAAVSPLTVLRIPTHTDDRTVISYALPVVSDVPIAENARRTVYALSLYGVKLDDYLREGMDHSRNWQDELWLGKVDQESYERSGLITDEFGDLEDERRLALLRDAAAEPVTDFGADYLWFGPFERSLVGDVSRLANRGHLSKVFENSAAIIFKIRR